MASRQPTIVSERYGEGDTFLLLNILPHALAGTAFDSLREEVKWNTMNHRGEWVNLFKGLVNTYDQPYLLGGEVPRLVAVEGTVDEDGRHA